MQELNGSPSYPLRHEQIGLWLVTRHSAFTPHKPGHGSRHFCSIHAVVSEHSELTKHSGRQLGGDPMYPGWQEHTHTPFCSFFWENGPHGFGSQGSNSSITGTPVGNREHCVIASPVYPLRQVHFGICRIVLQMALIPHVPGQGSIHLLLTHARSVGQSLLRTHSGRQAR